MRHIHYSPRCCVLIDGNYVDRLSRSSRFDFLDFAEFLRSRYQITNLVYFATVPLHQDAFPKRRLLDWLSYNGFVVKEKRTRGCGAGHEELARESVALEIAVHALEACLHSDGFVFVSDDASLCAAILALQRKNKWVALVGAEGGSGINLPNELRRTADVCLPVKSILCADGGG